MTAREYALYQGISSAVAMRQLVFIGTSAVDPPNTVSPELICKIDFQSPLTNKGTTKASSEMLHRSKGFRLCCSINQVTIKKVNTLNIVRQIIINLSNKTDYYYNSENLYVCVCLLLLYAITTEWIQMQFSIPIDFVWVQKVAYRLLLDKLGCIRAKRR